MSWWTSLAPTGPRSRISTVSTATGRFPRSTALELICGARNQLEVSKIDVLISTYEVIAVDEAIGGRAYELLKVYARSNGLRSFDSLIAATAMNLRWTLVTRNRKHFEMIDGLVVAVPGY